MNSLWKLTVFCWIGVAGSILASSSVGAQGPDLPPTGRSLFDHLVERIGGVLPTNAHDLVAQIEKTARSETAESIFPFSRSLQKGSVDLTNPRELFATLSRKTLPADVGDFLNSFDGRGVYFGHSPNAKTLEVISYNEKAGRYEFQIVRGFGPGLQPKVYYAPRALCMSCHQNGGPIFPIGGWNESEKNQKINAALKKQGYFDQPGRRQIEPFFDHDGAARYDAAVREGFESHADLFQRIWAQGCGSSGRRSLECRKQILTLVFETGARTKSRTSRTSRDVVKSLKDILRKTWPETGIEVFSSFIANRDPDVYPPGMPLPKELDPLTLRGPVQILHFEPGPDPDTVRMTGSETPDMVRPETLAEVLRSGQDFLNPLAIKWLVSHSPGKLEGLTKALDSKKLEAVLRQPVLNRRELFQTLLIEQCLTSKTPTLWDLEESKMLPPELDRELSLDSLAELPEAGLKRQRDIAQPVLQGMRHYCQSCHQSGEALPFNFMRGNDAQIMENLKNPPTFARVIDRLRTTEDSRLMPPPKSSLGEEFRANPAEREEIAQELEKWFRTVRRAEEMQCQLILEKKKRRK